MIGAIYYICAFLVISNVLITRVGSSHWMIRFTDFPRLQLFYLGAVGTVFGFFYELHDSWIDKAILVLVIFSTVYQLIRIYPYTPLARKEVADEPPSTDTPDVSVLVSNVLDKNRRADLLLKLIEKRNPDVILLMETGMWWEQAMQVLEDEYKYSVKVPLENAYGMHLYSRLKIEAAQVHYKIQKEVPSITARLVLAKGPSLKLYCLHPKPPSPTENETSVNRDAELLIYAADINDKMEPALVIGDLNDVAWSKTTRLFQQISGLLDPRKGRGFFSTFNAFIPFLRWPLDHVFFSEHFQLRSIARLPSIKSDHFPIFISLDFAPAKKHKQEVPEEATEEEEEWAEEKIKEGIANGNSPETE